MACNFLIVIPRSEDTPNLSFNSFALYHLFFDFSPDMFSFHSVTKYCGLLSFFSPSSPRQVEGVITITSCFACSEVEYTQKHDPDTV